MKSPTRDYGKKIGMERADDPEFNKETYSVLNRLNAKAKTRTAGRFSSAPVEPAPPLFNTPERSNPDLYKRGLQYNSERWFWERQGGDKSMQNPDEFMQRQDLNRSQSQYPKHYGKRTKGV